MIENVQNEFYQLENKQATRSKPCANIRQELEGKKLCKTFSKAPERKNMQNQTIFELCTDDRKSKYSCNPKDILTSAKKIMKKSTPSKLPQLLLLNFSSTFLVEKKDLMNTLIFVKQKYLLMKAFQMNQLPSIQTPAESLALWVLLLEQESNLPCINKVIKKYCKLQTHFTFKLIL